MTGFFYLTENVWKPLAWLPPIHHLPQLVQTLSARLFLTREKTFWKGVPLPSQFRKALCPWWASSLPTMTFPAAPAELPFQHIPRSSSLVPISYSLHIPGAALSQLCLSSGSELCYLLSPILLCHLLQTGFPGTVTEMAPQCCFSCSVSPGAENQLTLESRLQTCGRRNLTNALCPVGLLSLQPLLWSFAGLPSFSLVCSPVLSPPGDLGGALSLPYLHDRTDNLRPLIWAQHPRIHWPAWYLTYIFVSETLIISCAKQSLGSCHPAHPTLPHPIRCFSNVPKVIIHPGCMLCHLCHLPFFHSLYLTHHQVYRFYFPSISWFSLSWSIFLDTLFVQATIISWLICYCYCKVTSVVSDSVRPHPWDSPGKNTGVGCHFLLQCMKVKSESEVAQSCLTLRDPMDCSLPGSSVHGIFPGKKTGVGAVTTTAS